MMAQPIERLSKLLEIDPNASFTPIKFATFKKNTTTKKTFIGFEVIFKNEYYIFFEFLSWKKQIEIDKVMDCDKAFFVNSKSWNKMFGYKKRILESEIEKIFKILYPDLEIRTEEEKPLKGSRGKYKRKSKRKLKNDI